MLRLEKIPEDEVSNKRIFLSRVIRIVSVTWSDRNDAYYTGEKNAFILHFFAAPQVGTTATIPTNILQSHSYLMCHPSAKFRQNRWTFREYIRENVFQDITN